MPGPIYFAYVAQGTAFNAAVHNVEDEEIYSFEVDHSEGDFCALELTLRNPRIGLLNPTRKQWAYLSIDINWPNTPNIVPIFYGRVVGMPNDIQEEVIALSFLAKPYDLIEQKVAIAATYRAEGAPYWSPIWFDDETRDQPDNVLESRCELWDFNRVTHEVTTTNIINGEDGTLSFTADEVYYDGMSTSYGETPLKTIRMKASVTWDQAGTGVIEIGPHFNFGAGRGMPGGSGGGPGIILTYTGEGLVSSWPKSGASLGNGWSVDFGFALNLNPQPNECYTNVGPLSDVKDNPQSYRIPHSLAPPVIRHHDYEHAVKLFVPLYRKKWKTTGQDETSRILAVQRWRIGALMNVRYTASRRYTETISISLSADCQDILTDTGGEDVLDLAMSSSNVARPVDPGGALPIGDIRQSTYFSGDRGQDDIEYLISVMRARLLARARTVDITFNVSPFAILGGAVAARTAEEYILAAPEPPPSGGASAHRRGTAYDIKIDGVFSKARFWRDAGSSYTTRSLHLYNATTNELIASTVATNEGSTVGWIEAAFPVPVQVFAGDKVVISYDENGYIVYNIAAANTVDPAVATYIEGRYGPIGVVPFNSQPGITYYADLIWQAEAPPVVDAPGISCRMNAAFPDPRLPGGTVGGKIKNYKIRLDGDTGEFSCTITIGCTVGKGGTVEATAGEPCYVVAGVLAPGIQRMENEFIMPVAGEVIYKSINGLMANDDGLDLIRLDNKNCVKSVLKENGWAAQEAALSVDGGTNEDPAAIFKRLEPIPTRFTLVMKPVTGGPFLTEWEVEVSDLKIPMTINLEAGSLP